MSCHGPWTSGSQRKGPATASCTSHHRAARRHSDAGNTCRNTRSLGAPGCHTGSGLHTARAGRKNIRVGHYQLQWVITQDGRVPRRGGFAGGARTEAVDRAVGPGRIQIAVLCPAGIPRIGPRVFGVASGEGHAHKGLGRRKRAVARRLAGPGPVGIRRWRVGASIKAQRTTSSVVEIAVASAAMAPLIHRLVTMSNRHSWWRIKGRSFMKAPIVSKMAGHGQHATR